MPTIAFLLLATLRDTLRRRVALQLEVLALRQYRATMKRSSSRSSLRSSDRLFWVLLSRLWPAWRATLVMVRPETVITWHRKGCRLFWTWKPRRRRGGRAPIPREGRDIIRRMSRQNPLWALPGSSRRTSPTTSDPARTCRWQRTHPTGDRSSPSVPGRSSRSHRSADCVTVRYGWRPDQNLPGRYESQRPLGRYGPIACTTSSKPAPFGEKRASARQTHAHRPTISPLARA